MCWSILGSEVVFSTSKASGPFLPLRVQCEVIFWHENTSFEPTNYHNKFETMNFNGFPVLVFEKKNVKITKKM